MENVFYHISKDLMMGQDLEPRRPRFIMDRLENGEIERLCVSSTVEGCLTSIPGGGSFHDETLWRLHNCVKLFKIDTDKIGYNPKFIVTSDTLYRDELVWDADITKEHWLMNPVTLPDEDVTIISILDYDMRVQDLYTHEFEEAYLNNPAYEDEDITDLWAEYAEKKGLEETYLQSKTVIENVRYQTSKMQAGDTFVVYIEDDDVEEEVLALLEGYPVDADYSWGELNIVANECVDITDAILKIVEFLEGVQI